MSARVVIAAAALVAAAGVTSPAAAADTTEWHRSTAYVCAIGGLSDDPVDLALRIRTPASVAPGGSVTAEGTVTASFLSGPPGVVGLVSLSRTVRLDLQRLRLPVRIPTAGGVVERSVDVGTAAGSAAPVPALGAAFDLTASLRIPEIVLPADATGDVQIGMPVDGSTANTVGSNPPEVAFTGTLTYAGGLPSTLPVACRLTADRRDVVARVPVGDAPAAGGTTTATPPATTAQRGASTPRRTTGTSERPATERDRGRAAPAASAGSPPTASATPDAAPTPRSSGRRADEAPASAAELAAEAERASPAPAAAVWEAVPAATRGDGVVVPAWVLGGLLAIALAVAAAFAVHDHRRLRTALRRLRRPT